MSDVSIAYKGNTIAALDGTGSKTLKTAGTYCEGDIAVSYAPRSRTYELTLAKASGWVLLTTLDDDVLEHINDSRFAVSLTNMDGYAYEYYSISMAIASNTAQNMVNSYPVYGICARQTSETLTQMLNMFYPANKTDTSIGLGGAPFRIDGDKYYFRPADGYVRSGTYRLTFTW